MSLVQEALKKVQNKRTREESALPKQDDANLVQAAILKKPVLAAPGRPPISFKRIASFLKALFLAVSLALVVSGIFLVVGKMKFDFLVKAKAKPAVLDDKYQTVTYKALPAPQAEKPAVKTDALPEAKPAPAPKVEEKPAPKVEVKKQPALQPPQLVLNGIMYIVGSPRAIINGSTVTEGDSVSGAVVKKIHRESVVLDFNETEITIGLK